jgi:spore coat polysaccharide biosynthesis protein SpsF
MEAGQPNKIAAIIQARMESKRLPGKVLMPLPFGGPNCILGQIIDQLSLSNMIDEVYIATTVNNSDDEIEKFCNKRSIKIFRGDEIDVHSRFYKIIENQNIDTVIRITGDNPVIDCEILDSCILEHNDKLVDYSYSDSLPIGMNFEIFSKISFIKLSSMNLNKDEREHVTLRYKYDSSFKTNLIKIKNNFQTNIRLTVDYPSDYILVSTIFQISEIHGIKIGFELIDFVSKNYPWIFEINQSNFQKRQFSTLDEEIYAAKQLLKSFDFERILNLF